MAMFWKYWKFYKIPFWTQTKPKGGHNLMKTLKSTKTCMSMIVLLKIFSWQYQQSRKTMRKWNMHLRGEKYFLEITQYDVVLFIMKRPYGTGTEVVQDQMVLSLSNKRFSLPSSLSLLKPSHTLHDKLTSVQCYITIDYLSVEWEFNSWIWIVKQQH